VGSDDGGDAMGVESGASHLRGNVLLGLHTHAENVLVSQADGRGASAFFGAPSGIHEYNRAIAFFTYSDDGGDGDVVSMGESEHEAWCFHPSGSCETDPLHGSPHPWVLAGIMRPRRETIGQRTSCVWCLFR